MDKVPSAVRSPPSIKRWPPNRSRSTPFSIKRPVSRRWWKNPEWPKSSPWPWKAIRPPSFVTGRRDRAKRTHSLARPIWYVLVVIHMHSRVFLTTYIIALWCLFLLVPRPTGSLLGRTRTHLSSLRSPFRPIEGKVQVRLHLYYQSFFPGNLQRKGKR